MLCGSRIRSSRHVRVDLTLNKYNRADNNSHVNVPPLHTVRIGLMENHAFFTPILIIFKGGVSVVLSFCFCEKKAMAASGVQVSMATSSDPKCPPEAIIDGYENP